MIELLIAFMALMIFLHSRSLLRSAQANKDLRERIDALKKQREEGVAGVLSRSITQLQNDVERNEEDIARARAEAENSRQDVMHIRQQLMGLGYTIEEPPATIGESLSNFISEEVTNIARARTEQLRHSRHEAERMVEGLSERPNITVRSRAQIERDGSSSWEEVARDSLGNIGYVDSYKDLGYTEADYCEDEEDLISVDNIKKRRRAIKHKKSEITEKKKGD